MQRHYYWDKPASGSDPLLGHVPGSNHFIRVEEQEETGKVEEEEKMWEMEDEVEEKGVQG